VLVLAVLAAAACGTGQATPQPAQSPSRAAAVTTPAPPAPLSAWQRLGATEVPPASLQQVSLGNIQVVDQTNGAVGDRDARAWAESLLRSINYEFWAVSRAQDAFLLKSGLSSAAGAVYQPDLSDVAAAGRAGSHVLYVEKVIRRLVLRPVAASLRPVFGGQLFTWKAYAFYLDAIGPGYKYWVDDKGNRTLKDELQPGVPGYELVGGEMSHQQLLGDVFVVGSDFDCLAPASRQQLAPLCNP
jgi:hypothetical protein